MQRWEYMSIYVDSPELRHQSEVPTLKQLGEQGWELVSTTPVGDRVVVAGKDSYRVFRVVCILKRPKQ
jgi:Domain of unknown function (DUF4177)